MRIEKMEAILVSFVRKRSKALGHPIRQNISLVRTNVGLKVGNYSVEIGIDLILDDMDLSELVDKIIELNWVLFDKAKEEKRRIIEREKDLAESHLLELKRLCTTNEFTLYLKSFVGGALIRQENAIEAVPPSLPSG